MHFPMNIHIGNTVINSHVVFEILAYFIGFRYYLYLKSRSKDKISPEARMWLLIAGATGALLCSRTVGYFDNPLLNNHSVKLMMVHFFSAKSIVGGVLGGILGVEITKRIMGIKIYTGDFFVYPIILGMMIGRLGCFSQGIYDGTAGTPSNLPWAMDMGDGIPRHPAQLYEIIFLGLTWFFIKKNENHLSDGSRFKIFAIVYLIYRFVVEWIKPAYFYSFGLSAVQVACVIGFIYFIPVFLHPRGLLKEHNAQS